MNKEELNLILAEHKLWLEDKGGKRADLRDADLRNSDLRNADLSDADLRCSNLRNADLRFADLRFADLRFAYLKNADLRNADLTNANLKNADLTNANLKNADLTNASIPLYCKRSVSIINDKIRIGRKTKSIAKWEKWFASGDEFATKRGTKEFKRIEAMYRACKVYMEHMKKEQGE